MVNGGWLLMAVSQNNAYTKNIKHKKRTLKPNTEE